MFLSVIPYTAIQSDDHLAVPYFKTLMYVPAPQCLKIKAKN